MVYYGPSTGLLYLLDDTASMWTSGAPGSGGTLQNSACTLSLATSSVSATSTTVTVNFALSFAPSYAGQKNPSMYAAKPGLPSRWQAKGTWTVP